MECWIGRDVWRRGLLHHATRRPVFHLAFQAAMIRPVIGGNWAAGDVLSKCCEVGEPISSPVSRRGPKVRSIL